MAWRNNSRSFLSEVYNIKDNVIIEDYVSSGKTIIDAQLAKGGIILALILNDIFKSE